MYIYKITNKITGKVYIGQTVRTIEERYKQHKYDAPKLKYPLYASMRKHGVENFEVEEIMQCNSMDELNRMEEQLIKEYNCIVPNGYNVKYGGNNKKHHPDTKKKIGEKSKIYMNTPEARARSAAICKARTGWEPSPEFRKKMAEGQRGRKHPEEVKEKMRKAATGGGNSQARPVFDNSTGRIFDSILAAAEFYNIPIGRFRKGVAEQYTPYRHIKYL